MVLDEEDDMATMDLPQQSGSQGHRSETLLLSAADESDLIDFWSDTLDPMIERQLQLLQSPPLGQSANDPEPCKDPSIIVEQPAGVNTLDNDRVEDSDISIRGYEHSNSDADDEDDENDESDDSYSGGHPRTSTPTNLDRDHAVFDATLSSPTMAGPIRRTKPPSSWRGDSPRPDTEAAARKTENLGRKRLELQRLIRQSNIAMSTKAGPSCLRRRHSSSWDHYADTATPDKSEDDRRLFSFEDNNVFEDDDDQDEERIHEDEEIPRQRLLARSRPGRPIDERSQPLPRRSTRLKNAPTVCYKTLHATGTKTLKFVLPDNQDDDLPDDQADDLELEDDGGDDEDGGTSTETGADRGERAAY